MGFTGRLGISGSQLGHIELGVVGGGVGVAAPAPDLSTAARPYIAHLYNHLGVFKGTLGPLLNHPALMWTYGAGQNAITIGLPSPNSNIVRGDIVELTQQDSLGSVVYTGVVEDVSDTYGATPAHNVELSPLVVELGYAPFSYDYTVATDIAQMVRDIVATTAHCTTTPTSVIDTGIMCIFTFKDMTALQALEECKKMAGINYYFICDEVGEVWFSEANFSAEATYSLKQGVNYNERVYQSPITKMINKIDATGGIVDGVIVSATYDESGSSTVGVRQLIPNLSYPNLLDLTTLQNIVNTLGASLNRRDTTVTLQIPNLGTRISVGRSGGTTMRYFEPSKNPNEESEVGSGVYSQNLLVVQLEWDGNMQKVTLQDVAPTLSSMKYLIDRMMQSVTSSAATGITLSSGGAIPPGLFSSLAPAIPAGLAGTTGLDNISQTNAAFINLTWTTESTDQFVVAYEIQWRKTGDTVYYKDRTGANAIKIGSLIPGQSYSFAIRAENQLGNYSAYTSDVVVIAGVDVTAPSVPTGLAAIKTPRGALVSWAANTDSDLAGYTLEVSVGGGAYATVFDDTLITSFAYLAPSGTPTGTSLQFKIAAIDWSGNQSAFSAASTAVPTDGIIFDELLAGNLQVFGTLTAGGIRTAASGARFVIDSSAISGYDASVTDYGAGPGRTIKIGNDGSAFFSGQLGAKSLLTGGIQSSTVGVIPTIPGGFTGFQIDATNGLRFFNAGALTADFAINGDITIYSNATIYASTIQTGLVVDATHPGEIMSPFGLKGFNSSGEDLWGGTSVAFWLTTNKPIDNFSDLTNWYKDISFSAVTATECSIAAGTLTVNANKEILTGKNWFTDFKWQIRFQYQGNSLAFRHHYVDSNNFEEAYLDGSNIYQHEVLGGYAGGSLSAVCALTSSSWYWFEVIYTGLVGAITIYNDSGGSLGSVIANYTYAGQNIHGFNTLSVGTNATHYQSSKMSGASVGVFQTGSFINSTLNTSVDLGASKSDIGSRIDSGGLTLFGNSQITGNSLPIVAPIMFKGYNTSTHVFDELMAVYNNMQGTRNFAVMEFPNGVQFKQQFQCLAYCNVNQNLSSGSVISIDTVVYDPAGDFNTGTHQYTAPVPGTYLVCGRTTLNTDVDFSVDIYKNGSLYARGTEAVSAPSNYCAMVVTKMVRCAAGDTIDLRTEYVGTPGSALEAGSEFTYLDIMLIG
jgi:hypothetical protein